MGNEDQLFGYLVVTSYNVHVPGSHKTPKFFEV